MSTPRFDLFDDAVTGPKSEQWCTPRADERSRRLRIGTLWIDSVSLSGALQRIQQMVESGNGGAVFTPNVDHIVKAESNEAFKRAYGAANLSLADGMPLVWASRLLGCQLPERVAGSDLLMPLMALAAKRGWRVYLLGGAPGSAKTAAKILTEEHKVRVAGWDDCRIASDGSDPGGSSIAQVRAAQPDLILVALGPPKQELWIHRAANEVRPAVALGIGAGLDFIAGTYRRAPRWVARVGLEWAFRLLQEPARLWRRYLWEGPRFLGIFIRTWQSPRSERIQEFAPGTFETGTFV